MKKRKLKPKDLLNDEVGFNNLMKLFGGESKICTNGHYKVKVNINGKYLCPICDKEEILDVGTAD